MSDPTLLIAYRAMPSEVLQERIRLMRSVIAEREAAARNEVVHQLRSSPYIKQVDKKEAPDHLCLEPVTEGPPPSDGTLFHFRDFQEA